MVCDVCAGAMKADVLPQTFRCAACGFYKSSFPVRINEPMAVDEGVRELGLKPIRMANFAQLLGEVSDLIPPGATLLDVGCAHGWFLEAAAARGYKPTGLEPDRGVAHANSHIIQGYFPDAVDGAYDVITFNDVFEHLPTPARMMTAVADHLNAGGHAIINLPMSNGLVFTLSRFAARFGIRNAYERMWQKPYVSPHLSYFSPENLVALAKQSGLTLVRQGRLDSIQTNGLWERITCDQRTSMARSCSYYAVGFTLAAIASFAPADIGYFVFKKSG